MQTLDGISSVIDEINALSRALADDIVGLQREVGTEIADKAPEGIEAEIKAKRELAAALAKTRQTLSQHGERLVKWDAAILGADAGEGERFGSSVSSSVRRHNRPYR